MAVPVYRICNVLLPEEKRKDPAARKDAINSADIAFLCLPDAAAIEAVSLAENPAVKIIDTSTAHRTDPNWVYGMPELAGQTEKILASSRIANPGCHASGFVALVAPLVQAGILQADTALSCFSLTGYSGGGKKMIAQYESADKEADLFAPCPYGMGQGHKHLPEMAKICGLNYDPVFCPIVADFPCWMEVTVPLFASQIKGNIDDIRALFQSYYAQGLVRYSDETDADGLLSAAAWSGRDDMQVSVHGNEDRILLIARYDNLGKGASGAAIQNMNIMLGIDETTGLNI